MLRFWRVTVLTLVIGGPVMADSLVFIRPIHRVVRGRFSRVALNHRYGDIHITGQSDSGLLVLDAVVYVGASTVEAAQAFADAVDFDFQSDRKGIVITTRYPRPAQLDPRLSYDVHIDLAMPGSARLEVNNAFGDLRVTGVLGVCNLVNRFGQVEIEHCGQCEVTGRYGDVRTKRARGPVLVENAFGNVILDEVSDVAQVTNQYGTVQAVRMRGPTRITNVLGSVRARSGSGRMVIENHLGDVSATVQSPELDDLQILSRLGQVELNLARGVPFSLDGRIRHGRITPLVPLRVDDLGAVESVSARTGEGGPLIRFDGVFSDFIIRGDSEPGEE
ncbi:MAG: hypothetical protein ABIK86_02345 [candidate division WOR-3 bacterium]